MNVNNQRNLNSAESRKLKGNYIPNQIYHIYVCERLTNTRFKFQNYKGNYYQLTGSVE